MGTKQNSKNEEFLSSGRCRANPSVPVPVLIPAAQYVRKSTKLQQYSIPSQVAAIKRYAETRGFVITRTYADAGRSGVVLNQRAGLKELLQDVLSGRIEYKAILVYDVSRWGRFQDADESAHYEFLCKHAGVPVHYCAEIFSNDGTLTSALMKMMKRTMAGEYSRELGVKVFDAKKRLAVLGYRMGGTPGYGLRRMIVSTDRTRQRLLESGQYKSLTTDRVILVPGPRNEVKCVRKIYSLILKDRLNATQIAEYLNKADISYLDGRPWKRQVVERILTNNKYAGSNIWNQTSRRLHTPLVPVPPQEWAINPNCFSPVVPKATFDRVQRFLKWNSARTTDEHLLSDLKKLLKTKGTVSQPLIERTKGAASIGTYYRHFGSFQRVYELIGFRPHPTLLRKTKEQIRLRELRRMFMLHVAAMFPANISLFHQYRRTRAILRLDNSLNVSVLICRMLNQRQGRQGRRWGLYPVMSECDNVTLLCRLNPGNQGFHSFYMLRTIDKLKQCTLKENDPWLKQGKRLASLAQFYEVAKEFGMRN